MDFSYFVFRTVFMQIKNHMDRVTRYRKKKETLPDGVSKLSFCYWKDGNESRQGNLYYPVDRKDLHDLPLIIDIHGGCWIHGDKDVYDNFNYHLVRQNNLVSTVSYRTADEAHLGDMIRDIFSYLAFLKERHNDLGISLDHVMLTGDSAGAELCLITYCINHSPALQEIFQVKPVDIEFNCLVLTHPVCFIDQAASIPNQKWLSNNIAIPGLQKMLYGKNYHETNEYRFSVNPTKYVTPDIEFPPILLVTSEGDSVFKYQTRMLAEFFDSVNVEYTIYKEEALDAEHVFNINRPFDSIASRCNTRMVHFFHRLIGHHTTSVSS